MFEMLSDTEHVDALPDAPSRGPPKIEAPSIEAVDADPETLRTLRGQGRYFGVTDGSDAIREAERKCNNCSQRGHLKRDCPHVICTYCGTMDDHYSQHCPNTIKCSNCNENGHYRSQCPNKWKRVFCTLCHSKIHGRERCPGIWRVYLLRDDQPKRPQLNYDDIYCYNCGGPGHFGDDCPQRRSSRVPNDDGSAFSGDNLPQELKRQYFQHLSQQQRDCEGNQFDYNDYEFDETYYEQDRLNKSTVEKKNSNHRSLPRPSQRGKVMKPRGKNANQVTKELQNSRYNSAPSLEFQRNSNAKQYNPYKPFRSGTVRSKR